MHGQLAGLFRDWNDSTSAAYAPAVLCAPRSGTCEHPVNQSFAEPAVLPAHLLVVEAPELRCAAVIRLAGRRHGAADETEAVPHHPVGKCTSGVMQRRGQAKPSDHPPIWLACCPDRAADETEAVPHNPAAEQLQKGHVRTM